jgi:DNA-directed RNA polymerase specialized sigma subunit
MGKSIKMQKEIAKKLGISQAYVSRIEKKALSKLRKLIK